MESNNTPYLFNNPNVDLNDEGDVISYPGEVYPLHPRKAAWELEQTHDYPAHLQVEAEQTDNRTRCGDCGMPLPCSHAGNGMTRGY